MRRGLASFAQDISLLAWLIGLCLLQFGGIFCPALAVAGPLLNLLFMLALTLAWLLGRHRRHSRDNGQGIDPVLPAASQGGAFHDGSMDHC
jgi:hypothetical protein